REAPAVLKDVNRRGSAALHARTRGGDTRHRLREPRESRDASVVYRKYKAPAGSSKPTRAVPGGGGTGDGGNPPGTPSTPDVRSGPALRADFFLRLAVPARTPRTRSADCASKHRLGRPVRREIVHAVDVQNLRQLGAGAVHPALDRADSAAADLRRLFIGGAGRHHEDQGLALIGGQLRDRAEQF